MYLQSNTRQRGDQYRRYFPDWTDRPLRAGDELEADHNSYLAGGYAEEFGYLAQAEFYRGVPLIDGDSPDNDALRLVQWAGIHPGYPLRPYPISADQHKTLRRRALTEPSAGASRPGEFAVRGHGKFVRVAQLRYGREHGKLTHRPFAAVKRFLAAVFALR